MNSCNPSATNTIVRSIRTWICAPLLGVTLAVFGTSCQSMDPRNVDVELPDTLPQAKVTTYTEALSRLGDMTEIYASDLLKIQSNPIRDNTGASAPLATGGEIPRDITEMIKTSLNSIGGRVTFIPYDPAFVQNQTLTGYSNFDRKLIPNLVLSGGITEFDRGLLTEGENTDVSLEYEVSGIPDALPSKNLGVRYGDEVKAGLARITLDFNLLDFQTLSGIPKINAVNTMEVNKALGERELGVSLFGQSFGLKGSMKKVQGRHAAIRLLVELSMIQIVGKYLAVPYWRLLGDDAQPDPVVLQAVASYYSSLSETKVNNTIQQWLSVYGYKMDLNDTLDEATKTALAEIDPEFNLEASSVNLETFTKVYLNMPLTVQGYQNRQVLTQRLRAEAEQARLAAETLEPPLAPPTPVPAGADQPVASAPPAQSEIIVTQPASTMPQVDPVSSAASAQVPPKEPQQIVAPPQLPTTPQPVAKPEPAQQTDQDPKQYVEKQAPAPVVVQPIIRTGIGRFLTEGEWE